ncbi:MAG TPA: hypothetical protein VIV12_15105 [Streptosporangiaceae bacterium]
MFGELLEGQELLARHDQVAPGQYGAVSPVKGCRRADVEPGDQPAGSARARAAATGCGAGVLWHGPRHSDAGSLEARGRPGRHSDHGGGGVAVIGGGPLVPGGRAAGTGADVGAMRAVGPDLVEKESLLLGAALGQVVEGLPEGGRALVVGHSPTNEAAVLGLAGQVVAPLGKGEGALPIADGGDYRVEPLD